MAKALGFSLMVETLAIFEGSRKVYSTHPLDPLLLDAVTGLNQIAKKMYNDELVYFEMDGYSVNSFVGPKDIVIISFSKREGRKDLRHVYEAYCACMAYNDIKLMDTLLNKHKRS